MNDYFKVEVNTYGDPADSWASNGIKHDTSDAAKEAAEDLFCRWTAVKFWRVVNKDGVVFETGE